MKNGATATEDPQNILIKLPFDPKVLLRGLHPKELKLESGRDICTFHDH